ncbi:MAG: UMP kinase [Marinilabiliaceae bacterium]|nr:UMP kinase [Marinilabiliaceae bacterium]
MKYRRILLKLSGEALQGDKGSGISPEVLKTYASQIKEISGRGCEVAIVIGGGNIFRGLSGTEMGYDRLTGDQMGMLATVINSLALESELHSQGVRAKVFTSIRMEPVGELYRRDEVLKEMEAGGIAILAGGTGNPFFTTDTAAALRAVETGADVLLKGTRVDGVYDSDPEKNPAALKFDRLSFDEALDRGLKIMDQTAFTMCKENSVKIIVFNMNKNGNLAEVAEGKKCGTLIS